MLFLNESCLHRQSVTWTWLLLMKELSSGVRVVGTLCFSSDGKTWSPLWL